MPATVPKDRRKPEAAARGRSAEVSALAVEGAARPGRVCVGAVAGAHGVRGDIRIKSFTQRPEDIAAYGPLEDERGNRIFALTLHGRARGQLIGSVEGIQGRKAAEALKGVRLYVDRARLPAPEEEDEFYHADLLGLSAADGAGNPRGRIAAILPVGDTAVLEIDPGGGKETILVPFTREHVPEIDIAAGRIVIDPPEEPGEETGDTALKEKGDERR